MHENQTERGQLVWHSSDEDGGPDVGVSIGIGNGGQLWIGELSRHRWEAGGGMEMGLGLDGGSWLLLYPSANAEPIILGRCPAETLNSDLGELFAAMIQKVPAATVNRMLDAVAGHITATPPSIEGKI